MLECRLAKAALRIVATTKTWVPQVNATYCTADAGLIAIAEGLKFRCLSPSVITGCPRKTVPRTREVTINCSHSAGMKHGLELTLAQRRASAMGGSGVLLFVVNCMNGRANQQSLGRFGSSQATFGIVATLEINRVSSILNINCGDCCPSW